jgi:RND superfamily putative drug exporter
VFIWLAERVVRRRRIVLVVTGLLVVVAGVVGTGVFDKLSGGGFQDPDAESSRAADLLESRFDAGDPDLVLLVTARNGTVDDPDVAAAGGELV